jgi:hypothetical protein
MKVKTVTSLGPYGKNYFFVRELLGGGGLKVCSTLAPDRRVVALSSGGKNGRGVLMADKEIGK